MKKIQSIGNGISVSCPSCPWRTIVKCIRDLSETQEVMIEDENEALVSVRCRFCDEKFVEEVPESELIELEVMRDKNE